ncbi:adenylyltransferase/cytidyltransferase family protein [Daejeonella oryzae]|uniref:adenylyltransferase/cytidyltransferase family protein n=1 Tax=Daejeonella oryzae TaxID=1122943 RepID=UPI0003FADC89|nr:adenylyltransferase/cytidyltransferase family protein [Daejeonella oryzae]
MTKLEILQRKIVSVQELLPLLHIWKFKGNKVVFTNGCFDLLHRGHIDYLSKAADLGDRLIVGLNTDLSTNNLKGEGRPITDELSRATLLASLFFVEAVVLFDEPTPLDLIKIINPEVLVKGADYSINQIIGADYIHENGGRVETIEFLPGYSTSLIEQKIKGL